MRSALLLAFCILAFALGACSMPERSTAPTLSLRLAAEVTLEESDSSALGAVGGFNLTRDGKYILADRQRGALVVFGADGRRERVIGRRGSGPGEWESGPFGIHSYDDSTFVVSDASRLKMIRLTRPVEEWTRAQSPMTSAFAAHDGVVLTRGIDRTRRSTIARFSGAHDSLVFGGPFPPQLGRSRIVDQMLVFVGATMLAGDSVAVLTQGSDHLYFGPFAGPFDSLLVPATERRGAMTELLSTVRDDDPDSGMRAAYKASYPYAIHPIGSTGLLALLTIDQEFLGNRMAGTLHLSVVNLAARRVCGEVSVPVESDPMSWPTVVAETLVVFSHDVDPLSLRSTPTIRRFVIETDNCE